MAELYIGRQPIFDKQLQVHGYELLFRDSPDSTANIADGDSATAQVLLNAFVEIGLENLVGKHQAFINLTRGYLLDNAISVLPSQQTVLEILEDVEVDDALVESVERLKGQGYRIALDDFVYDSRLDTLIKQANIIKFDVLLSSREEIARHARSVKQRNPGVQLLAEKVETHDEFEHYRDQGFDFFQGFFLCKPRLIKAQAITTNQALVYELMSKVLEPDTEITELAELIERDISLSHKTLRYINSPTNGMTRQVDSIRQAITLLGLDTIRNWVIILVLAKAGDKSSVLYNNLLVRARVCEALAMQAGLAKPTSFFTVGLLSGLDAIMDTTLKQALDPLPLAANIKDAITHKTGDKGLALHCALALETGDTDSVAFKALEWDKIVRLHTEALQWADEASRLCS
jgi:EAL and modified HD-GYP domain-containing signal transduction protein